ncbi:MAG: DUF4287 domain-containing protein [Actinobacteria bacterium]|uniref:Unannotated protein n=1 Tax=freshwater metagenome TaxID=449393 RepID=A0A6J6V7K3_9ZZZZ|nr:DUF4287 domain-containing protein [Actinomycetota bacterium]
MASKDGDRSKFFPAIEKKHGEKVSFWINRLKELETTKYPEQIAYLKENYGFSQAHANALVMYVRGSTTSKRFDSPDNYFSGLDAKTAKTMKAIFAAITANHKGLELVMAWNQPMLRLGKDYVIGLSVSKNHIAVNPFSVEALDKNLKKLEPYTVNKYTFQVPLDWKVDAALISSLAKVRIAEIMPQKG